MTTVDRKERGLVKNSYRGLTLDQLEQLSQEELVGLFRARIRRRFSRSTPSSTQRSSTSTPASSTSAGSPRRTCSPERSPWR